MEVFSPLKLKRKDLEDVSDDFSDFSLSSPSRKIRRLNAELPPIVEEEECEMPIAFDHRSSEELSFSYNSPRGPKIEELSSEPRFEERAIVLYKPSNTTTASPLLSSPSSYSISMSPQLLSGFKNHVLLPKRSNSWRQVDEEAEQDNNYGSATGCLALIPWTQSQTSFPPVVEFPCEEMEEEEAMDVEDHTNLEQNIGAGGNGMTSGDDFHHWQQHCLIPQPPQNTSAPIVWHQ